MESIISKPLVSIVGETASGKSSLAMVLAERFNGEIISADSWAVYRNFDIGTAKPTKEESGRIPHHLIDVADPEKGYNAALYKRQAEEAIQDIEVRNKLPIVVGGTGLYIDSLIYDYSFLPATTPELRSELNALSLNEIQDRVRTSGLSTHGIDVRNKRRLIRLLENNGRLPTKSVDRDNTLVLGMTLSRDELHNRISDRIEKMIARGLPSEVAYLSKRYGWQIEPMKGIGYREFFEYFNGQQSLEETKEKIVNSTMALAKKQRTWFKRNKSIHWVQSKEEAVDLVTTFLNK